jgi:hypothetical protein
VGNTSDKERPLVVTLRLDRPARERFEAERIALFPRGRTAVGAHVTLFHALPGYLRQEVEAELGRLAGSLPLPVEITGVVALGRGVAYGLAAPQVQVIHRRLQDRWHTNLTRQDAQALRLHVTVQNKVEPDVAKATFERLRDSFQPGRTRAIGLELWRYDGGPWAPLRRWSPDSAG